MSRILVVAGTRPEAIKLAPVINELKRRDADVRVCVTGQHREMLDQVLEHFEIRPDLDLNVMTDGQTLEQLTSIMTTELASAYEQEQPDIVVMQGDTTTVMAAAMAAFYAGIDVAHVEAGLRSHDMRSPFPEEFNRRVVSLVATYHFAPTPVAEAQLIEEGVDPSQIWMTGNTIIDALVETAERPITARATELLETAGVGVSGGAESEEMGGCRLIFVTAHRRENFGAGIEEICDGVKRIVGAHPDATVIYPVHMNRNVAEPVSRILRGEERVYLTEPLDYATTVHLMKHATLILTDSGGIQEEAPTLGKPVLVMRTETERPEGIEAGTAILTGPSAERIEEVAGRLLSDTAAYEEVATAVNPYGDGLAASRIADVLLAN